MSTQNHILKRVNWNTSFDNKEEAPRLQQQISSFTNISMAKEIATIAEQYCPSNEHWRLGTLNIDLGSIRYDKFDKEVVEKFKTALYDCFKEIVKPGTSENQNLTVNTIVGSELEAIVYFLNNGSMPWWLDKAALKFDELFKKQLKINSAAITLTIRKEGEKENIRKRLVWQLPTEDIKTVVHLLEPQHGEAIINYVENIHTVQEKKEVVKTGIKQFEKQTWFWVLTQLLVDRGSYFNTKSFVMQTIKQMAGHYNLNFNALLTTMVKGVKHLNVNLAPVFIKAISEIEKTVLINPEKETKAPKVKINKSWTVLRLFVNQKNTSAPEVLKALLILIQDEPTQLKFFILQKAKTKSDVQFWVNNLKDEALQIIVEGVDKNNAAFIISHVKQIQNGLAPASQSKAQHNKAVWEIVLIALFIDRGTYFNKRSFIKNTLQALCLQRNIEYYTLLTSFKNVYLSRHASLFHQIEFTGIINDLLKECGTSTKETDYRSVEIIALQAWLTQGRKLTTVNGIYVPSAKEIIANLLYTNAVGLVAFLRECVLSIQLVARVFDLLNKDEFMLLLAALNNDKKDEINIYYNALQQTVARIKNETVLVEKYWHIVLLQLLKKSTDFSIENVIALYVQSSNVKLNTWLKNANASSAIKMKTKESLKVYKAIKPNKFVALLDEKPAVKPETINATFIKMWKSDQQDLLNSLSNNAIDLAFCKQLVTRLNNKQILLIITAVLSGDKLYKQFIESFKNTVPLIQLQSILLQALLLTYARSGNETHFISTATKLINKAFKINAFTLLNKVDVKGDKAIVHLLEVYKNTSFKNLLKDLKAAAEPIQKELKLIQKNLAWLKGLNLSIAEKKSIENYICNEVINAIINNNWKSLTGELFIENILEVLFKKHKRQHIEILDIMENNTTQKPRPIKDAMEAVQASIRSSNTATSKEVDKTGQPYFKTKKALSKPVEINNAGLVIIQSYIKMYFERLGLLNDSEFENEENIQKAIHYLQYVVTGQSHTAEEHLALNKVLCGFDMTTPVSDGFTLSKADIELAEGMMEAIINYWSAIGKTSLDGFRGNWLVRAGTLTELEDNFELKVERRAYDILLEQSPFSFSVIGFKWMPKPLYVTWVN